jgi:adenylate kinase family enzyme
MQAQNTKYFFLDGFPRTVAQAELFEQQGVKVTAVLFLDVPDTELTKRLLKRGETSGRSDDNQSAIVNRLQTYHNESYPVIQFYEPKGKVVKLNGFRSLNAIRADILYEIRKFWDIPVKAGEPQRETDGSPAGGEKQAKCCTLS